MEKKSVFTKHFCLWAFTFFVMAHFVYATDLPTGGTVTNEAPAFSVDPSDGGSSSSTPTNEGADVTFTATAIDPNSEQWYLAICKTDSITPNDDAPPTCATDQTIVVSQTAVNSGSESTVTYTAQTGDPETNAWYAFACDKAAGGGLCSSSSQGSGDIGSPFVVNHRPVIGTTTIGPAYGSTASIDPGVGGAGGSLMVTTPIGTAEGRINALAIQGDGKIVAAGRSYNTVNSVYDFAVARYNPADFSLDTDFGTGGVVTTAIGSDWSEGEAVAIQDDGKIVVGGQSGYPSPGGLALVRYNTDGSLDTGFGTDGVVAIDVSGGSGSLIKTIAIQSDGKIVAGGGSNFALARFNTDGSLDTGFGSSGVATVNQAGFDTIESIAILGDGKIVAGGTGMNVNWQFSLAQFNSDGTLDTNFGTNGTAEMTIGFGSYIESIAVQNDGKIVVGGQGGADFAIARYNADGTLDTGFGTSGVVTTALLGNPDNAAHSIALQSDGKIVAAGYTDSGGGASYFGLVRYNTGGTLDSSFGSSGVVTTNFGHADDRAFAVILQGDGKIIAAGGASDGTKQIFGMVRYTTSGAVDVVDVAGAGYVRVAVTDPDTDTTADTIDLHVCSTNSFTNGACDGTTLCTATGVASGSNADCFISNLVPIPTMHGTHSTYVFLKDNHGLADAGTNNTHQYSVTDIAPTISSSSSYSVNGTNNTIDLVAGDVVNKSYSVTITDNNGDTDITGATGALYDSGVGSLSSGTCTASDNNCYPNVTCNLSNNTSGTDANTTATCDFTVWFNANYSSSWKFHVNPADGSGSVTHQTDSSDISVNAVQGINIPTNEAELAYGTLALGAISSGIGVTLQNMGNQVLDVLIQGSDMTQTGGSATISAGQQHWHNTVQDFTYGDGNALLTNASAGTTKATGCADRNITVRADHASGTASDEMLYYKIQTPSVQAPGTYTGTGSVSATASNTCTDGE